MSVDSSEHGTPYTMDGQVVPDYRTNPYPGLDFIQKI